MSDRIFVINRGVIQQVGSPTEVYRKPANQFVADFVGTINFLRGEVKNGRIELAGLGQSIPYDGIYKGKVVVAIRPENMSLLPTDKASLTGKLTRTFYLGDVTDCRVDVGGGQYLRLVADSRSYDSLTEDQELTVYIDDFLVYEDDGREDHTKIIT